MDRQKKNERWIKAAFAELARSGVEGVRVEVLAANLGITKGGFYRRFRDRRALLDNMLRAWRQGRIAAVEEQLSLDGTSPRDRLREIIQVHSEHMNTKAMAIELAIRQWARSDETAAIAVATVDTARLKHVAQLYRATGLSADDAEAKALLFYTFVFGRSLLFLERGPRKRAQLLANAVKALVE